MDTAALSVGVGALCFIAGVIVTLLVARRNHHVHLDWRLRISMDEGDSSAHDGEAGS
jgi:hypothetical protein